MLGVVPYPGSSDPYPVAAGGFLLGALTTHVLYGIHLSQVTRYYHRFGASDRAFYRFLLVPIVFTLSSFHIAMIIIAMYHYFVQGIVQENVWGYFYWSLSAQDCLIPTVSAVSHVFFGYRVYGLSSIKTRWWYLFLAFVAVTFLLGIAFGVLARLWAQDPFIPYAQFQDISVGPAANALPTVWLSCAACIDGGITASLVYMLYREKHDYRHTKALVMNVIRLTLETVLLTHIIGATLFVLWLTSRTTTNAFWFFIEIISEMYALSVLFTLNSRNSFRKVSRPDEQYMVDRQLNELNSLEAARRSVMDLPTGHTSSTAIDHPQSADLTHRATLSVPLRNIRPSRLSSLSRLHLPPSSPLEEKAPMEITLPVPVLHRQDWVRQGSGSSGDESPASPAKTVRRSSSLPSLLDALATIQPSDRK
ncbi:hypothetical protein EMMF5_003945 [Cystobasidiomycetes sp. EMM_F5]